MKAILHTNDVMLISNEILGAGEIAEALRTHTAVVAYI